MINILWMIILIIILLLIILLLLGIRITLNYSKTGSKIKGCLKILIFRKIKVYSAEYPRKDDDTNEEDDEHERRDIQNIIKLAKPCFKDLKEFIKEFLKSIKIIKIKNHIIFGLNSYADTGMYIGIIWGFLSIINQIDEKIQISAEPSFQGQRLDGEGVNEIEIRFIKLIKPLFKLISKKRVLKLIKGVIDEIRKNN